MQNKILEVVKKIKYLGQLQIKGQLEPPRMLMR